MKTDKAFCRAAKLTRSLLRAPASSRSDRGGTAAEGLHSARHPLHASRE